MLVLIKGAGDLATGTAVRLYRAGIKVVMTEVAQPTAVRRTVAFSQCMYDGAAQVEGISARRAEDAGAARRALERGEVPVLCDPEAAILRELPFDGVVDAILAKVKEKFAQYDITDIDGVKIDFPDKWVHLRKSNTEPIIRIYSEAHTMKEAEEIGGELIAVINEMCK